MHNGAWGQSESGNASASIQDAWTAGISLAFNLALRHIRRAAVKSGKSGRSSGVEHNLAKVGVVGSNPIARSNVFSGLAASDHCCGIHWKHMESTVSRFAGASGASQRTPTAPAQSLNPYKRAAGVPRPISRQGIKRRGLYGGGRHTEASFHAGYKDFALSKALCRTSDQTANGRVSRAQIDASKAKISGPSIGPLAAMLMRRANRCQSMRQRVASV